ncbi:hypothetical protein GCM10009677_13560 [Sphaerisporangium rubeum]|uniref:AAA family ATPase n=1 Tax=Sphaerisporangium rubeum TaxID=321317 RepID=UPI0031D8C667
MRLHRLALTAFGSFPAREEVDFDALGDAGLFLVHGPTGAGKTTVLDAVCYALYGRVPGQRDSARRLRCDHAPPGRAPEVVLETTLRGRRLRVTRSPAWERPKLRGDGTVEQKPKILLEELLPTGEWTFRSSRLDEAGDLIGGLLGMNADQFWQVAMLPQGDFARFLRADGDDRRRLLEKLFSVRLYTAVEQWLADHRTRAGQNRQTLRQQVDSTLDHMRGAAGPLLDRPAGTSDAFALPAEPQPGAGEPAGPLPARQPGTDDPADPLPAPQADSDPAGWAAALVACAARVRDDAGAAAKETAGTLRAARDALESARDLAKLQRTHAEALARRDDLDRTADERADLETILAEAARAGRVLPLIQQAEHREETAGKAADLAADALTRAVAVAGGEAGVEELALLERDRRDEVARLEQLTAEENRLAELREELGRTGERLDRLAEEEKDVATLLAELPSARRQAGEKLAAARLAASRLSAARAEVEAAHADVETVRRRDTLAVEARAALEELDRVLEPVAERLSEEYAELVNRSAKATGPAHDEPASVGRLAATGPDRIDPVVVGEWLAEVARSVQDEVVVLEARLGDEERLAEVERGLAEVEVRLREVAAREPGLADARDGLPARVAAAEERLAVVRADAAAVPAALAARDAAVLQAEQAERRDALEGELAEAEEARRAATDEAQEARDLVQAVRQARLDGMAAELAQGLHPGEPCAVCGSDEHPAPAAPDEAAPTSHDEQEAEARDEAAWEARQAAEERVAVLAAHLEEAAAQAGGLGVAEALAAIEEAEAELARLEQSAAGEPALAEEAVRLRAELEVAEAGARELAVEAAEARTARAALREEFDRLTRTLDAARGDDPSVTSRRDRRTEDSRLLQTAIEAATRAVETSTAGEAARAAGLRTRLRPRPTAGWVLPWAVATASREEPAQDSDDPAVPAEVREEAVCQEKPLGDTLHEEEPAEADEPVEDEVLAVLAEAERVLAWVGEEAAREEELRAESVRVEEELAEAGERSARVGVEIAGVNARRDGVLVDVERLGSLLEEARGEDASLSARLERLTHEAELLRDAAEARRAAGTAEAEAVTAWERAERAAREAGFPGVEDVGAAARDAATVEEMSERLRTLDAERAAVGRTLADPALLAAAALPAPDLSVLEAVHDEAEREHAARLSARDQAVARHDQLAGFAVTLDETLAEWRPAEEAYVLAKRLAELTGGTSADNAEHIRLSSYVLGERLRQVVDAANERLDHMSGGRYLLLYDTARTAADRRRSGGGLGLKVLDGWTGTDRDPATLSGGEAFMTSLALALALADVVTAEAGGVELGTLFIDEGFGTLDEDTLDAVLDILDDLRDGGRAVGIVSHVAELRSRVPAQLKVRKNRDGSTLTVAVPG